MQPERLSILAPNELERREARARGQGHMSLILGDGENFTAALRGGDSTIINMRTRLYHAHVSRLHSVLETAMLYYCRKYVGSTLILMGMIM